MPPSTSKRIVLYRWDRQPEAGVIDPSSYLFPDRIEWITLEGRLQLCPFDSCKAVCFVSENGKSDLFTHHTVFTARPRLPGLWTRFFFRDGTMLDGVLSHNLLEWPLSGFFLIPPQAKATRQRVFLPRAALIATELRGVVGGAAKAGAGHTPEARPDNDRQLSIFDL